MRKHLIARGLGVLSLVMACAACRVAMETDFQNAYVQSARRSTVPQMVLVATQEAPVTVTKTALNGQQVVWSTGDQIKVFNASTPNGVTFTLKADSAGQGIGEFEGDPISGDGPFYAVYPASVAGSLTAGAVSVNIPNAQDLTAGSFGNNANVAMAQAENLADGLHFKNVLGAVCIQLSGEISATRIRIQTKGTEPLWGSGTVQMVEDVPSLSLNAGTVDNQIVEATGSATGTAFYLMLPPDALASGFITQVAAGENAMLKEAPADESNKIARSGIIAMPAFAFENQVPSSFLDISAMAVPFGYWANFSYGQNFAFDKTTSQFASNVGDTNRTFRMQDFSTGKMYSFVLPKVTELGLGGNYSIYLESVEGSSYLASSLIGKFHLVQKTSNAGWFVSTGNQKGFIISLED